MSATLETPGEKPDVPKGAERALSFPVGVASPLWLLYAGAAGAGVAYWLMTRWARPVNLEALLGHEGAVAAAPVAEALEAALDVVETAAAATAEEVESVAAEVEQALEEAIASEPVAALAAEPASVEVAVEPVVGAAPEPSPAPEAPAEPEVLASAPPEEPAPKAAKARSSSAGPRASSRTPSGPSRRG